MAGEVCYSIKEYSVLCLPPAQAAGENLEEKA